MIDLFEPEPDPEPASGAESGGDNAHEFTVSEISGAVKRTIEGEFGRVRVRGEVGRVSQPRSGHLYFDLKDDRSVLAAVSWKGQVARMQVRPEEGMEVVATGRLTTFPGQSKYQLIVDDVRPAGVGALMAMLEARRRALAAEGLFDADRKRPLPYLPEVIGVITSPSGAVIRDILHRLRDRFPRRVLIWPVAVQGEACAPEVARAIAGFNRLATGGPIPRPDLLIVARGGGSLEDLWGFNDEAVVRAAAASRIPLISAVGHETDTTLIDHAADRRAPTPTAAAEIAVPVRLDLLAWTREQGARLAQALAQRMAMRRQRLGDLARALPRPERLTEAARQRLDRAEGRLDAGLRGVVQRGQVRLSRAAGRIRPTLLAGQIRAGRERLGQLCLRAGQALGNLAVRRRDRLGHVLARLRAGTLVRDLAAARADLGRLAARGRAAMAAGMQRGRDRLAALDRVRESVGYTQTLRRGYAVVRGGGHVLTSAGAAAGHRALEIEFQDGRLHVAPPEKRASRPRDDDGDDGQESLF